MTIEDAVFTVIKTAIESSEEGSPLFGVEIHDTVYEPITADAGIRIGDCQSDLAPTRGFTEITEFDAALTVVFYARIAGMDKSDRQAARNQVRNLVMATAKLFFEDPTLGGNARDCIVGRLKRGYDAIKDGEPYAVGNLPLVVNYTGQAIRRD
jgi:hypothetical protein